MKRRRVTTLARLRVRLRRLVPSAKTVTAVQRSVVAVAAMVVAGLLGWASLNVKRHVDESERYYLDNWHVEFAGFPDWVTPEIQEEITSVDLTGGRERRNLLRAGVIAFLRDQIEGVVWVRDVVSLDLSWPSFHEPGKIQARLKLRVPVAIVESGGLHYLTDRDGLRLGHPYRSDPGYWFQIPLLTGLEEPLTIPAQGETWDTPAVLEGASVAAALYEAGIHRDYPDRPIEAINLDNIHGRRDPVASEVVLLSAGQALEWGRSPRSRHSRALSIEDKLRNLRAVLESPETRAYGRISLFAPDLVGVRGGL